MNTYDQLLRLLEENKDNERDMKLILRFAEGLTRAEGGRE